MSTIFSLGHVKSKYDDQARSPGWWAPDQAKLFTDTDSLCYHIQMKDVYKDMQEDQDRYDDSDYPQNHMFHSKTNKKVIGKSKDERVGEIHQEFIGLRAKIFSFMMDSEKKTAKGV